MFWGNEDMEMMRRDMNRMMRNLWGGLELDRTTPAMDIFRENGKLVMEVDMPGVSKDDINLQLTENQLSVSAQKKKVSKEEKEGFYRAERSWKSYKRTTVLPEKVNPERVEAKYKNGTLRVEAPLKEEERKRKKIEVK